MGFDFGKAINEIVDNITKNRFVNTVAHNPIFTALACVAIIVLIIVIVFWHSESSEGLAILSLRAGFWTFIFLSGILVLHNRVLMHESTDIKRSSVAESLFTDTDITGDLTFV